MINRLVSASHLSLNGLRMIGVALLPLLLLLSACVEGNGDSAESATCPEGLEPATEYRLYFGLTDDEGRVIEQAVWQGFVNEVVTPRFPDGLTILDAQGQWQPPAGELIRQSTRVLVVGVPDSWEGDAWGLMSEITAVWNDRHGGVAYNLVQKACAGLR